MKKKQFCEVENMNDLVAVLRLSACSDAFRVTASVC